MLMLIDRQSVLWLTFFQLRKEWKHTGCGTSCFLQWIVQGETPANKTNKKLGNYSLHISLCIIFAGLANLRALNDIARANILPSCPPTPWGCDGCCKERCRQWHPLGQWSHQVLGLDWVVGKWTGWGSAGGDPLWCTWRGTVDETDPPCEYRN